MKKALVDHALRLRFYENILFWMSTDKFKGITFRNFNRLTPEQRKYLGFKDDQIDTDKIFEFPDLTPPLFKDDNKIWELLKDDFNKKNESIK